MQGKAPHSHFHFPMKAKLLLVIGPLLIAACATPVQHPLAREMHRSGVEPETFQIANKDEEMHRAVIEARKNVSVFIAALNNPGTGQHDFEVKKPFVQGADVEHIWLSDVEFKDNLFYGLVDNHPSKIKGVKFGDRASVSPEKISDWAFVDNGKLVGGYTIRVLSENLSAERRKSFENETKVRIETQ